ncbi:hypothetical protein HDZ31DRAFT_84364 [Schizophyllum fasciatum]
MDEQDTCRICSAPAEPGQPLFHPCKCSGTIRYIHQDCLQTWLAHSKKKTCDVCKYSYAFTKVYAPDMPQTLPPWLIARRAAKSVFSSVIFCLRAIMVATIWLGVLPFSTVYAWRAYFRLGNVTAYWIANRQEVDHNATFFHLAFMTPLSDVKPTRDPTPEETAALMELPWYIRVFKLPPFDDISADIFAGQIIASFIVLTFVAIFLLREWIAQNARPGVFEDEEPPPPLEEAPVPAPQLEEEPVQPPPRPPVREEQGPVHIPRLPTNVDARYREIPEGGLPVQGNNMWTSPQHHAPLAQPTDPERSASTAWGMPPPPVTIQPTSADDANIVEPPVPEGEAQNKRPRHMAMRELYTNVHARRLHRFTQPERERNTQEMDRRIPEAQQQFSPQADPSYMTGSTDTLGGSSTLSGSNPQPFGAGFSSNPATDFSRTQWGPEAGMWGVPGPSTTASSFGQTLPRLNIPNNTAFTFTAPPDAPRPNLFAPAAPFSNTNYQVPSGSFGAQHGFGTQHNFGAQQSFGAQQTFSAQQQNLTFGVRNPQFSFGVQPAIQRANVDQSAMNVDPPARSPSPVAPSALQGIAGSSFKPVFGSSTQGGAGPSRFPGSLTGPASTAGVGWASTSSSNAWGGTSSPAAATPPLLTPTRRPPLPPTTTPLRSPGLAPAGAVSGAAAPLDSPSLALYRAPEELRQGYFDDVRPAEGEAEVEEKGKAAANDETPSSEEWESIDREQLDRYFPEQDEGDEGEEDGHVPGAFMDMTADEYEERHPVGQEDRDEEIFVANDLAADDGARQGAPGDAGAPVEVEGGMPEEIDIEGNVDDDIDGALEAIGMRGRVGNVLSNALLMSFVLDTAIGLGIWIPFTIGKTTALLMLDPPRLFKLVQLPMVLIRILTDPIVNGSIHLVVSLVDWVVPLVLGSCIWFLRIAFGRENAAFIAAFIAKWTMKAYQDLYAGIEQILSSPVKEARIPSNVAPQPSLFWNTLVGKQVEGWFAPFGGYVKAIVKEIKTTWTVFALEDQPPQRGFAVILGYSMILLGAGIYLNLLSVGNVQTATRAIRNTVRQQLVVLKVAFFIFIEIAMFPLGCGFILDASTLWMFSDVNLAARTEFFKHAPLTATFYHWVAGTMFMYTFAVILAGCRTIMRPGAMWFIKDPQDANAHPIRDILDRSALTHLRKIFMSGIMYALVVGLCVASFAALLSLGWYSILPLRWKAREPLSNVPIDLVFLHIALPYTMRYFRPKKFIKTSTVNVWKWLASRLRLSSYFFNEKREEEITAPSSYPTYIAAYLDSLWTGRPLAYDQFVKDRGSWRRVPANDNIPIPPEMRATVAVNEEGLPVDDESRRLMAQQDAEIERSKRKPQDEFVVVYLPPLFRYRIIAFILSFWTIGSACAGVLFILPLQLGRLFFQLWIPHEIHDGYSFLAGFYLLWACTHIMRAVDRLDKRRQRTGEEGPRSDLRVYVLKRGSLWLAKVTYLAICLGVIIPTLTALLCDCYVILPLRFTFDPTLVPRVRLVDSWALGLLYMKALSVGFLLGPRNSMTRGLTQMMNGGITHPDPIAATKLVIAPVVGSLLLLILFPAAVFKACLLAFPGWGIAGKVLFTRFYPSILFVALTSVIFEGMHETIQKWQQDIRDSEFLVEMRLRNLDPQQPDTGRA